MINKTCHLAISKTNKILIDTHCKAEFLRNHDELEGSYITTNQLITSMIRHYLGLEYYQLKAMVENEHNRNKL